MAFFSVQVRLPKIFNLELSTFNCSRPVAARSPRCHTLISLAARIFARDAIVRLGCSHWGLYGIA
jgi:hypothetical protein